jgi:hypothetical protein
VNLADWTGIFGDPAESLRIYREGIEFTRKRGAGRPVSWARAETTWRLFDLGRWDELLALSEEVAAWEEGHGGPAQPGVIATIERAHVFAYRGRNEDAVRLEEWFLPRARDIGDPQVLWQALMVASVIRWASGDREGAGARAGELVGTTAGEPMRAFWIVPEAVRVLAGLGDVEACRALATDAVVPIPTLETKRLVLEATIAEADRDPDRAAGRYREAAEAWGRGGYVFERAQSLLGWGRCLLALGRPEASDVVRDTREVFRGLGASPLVGRCDDLLRTATALTS